MSAATYVYVSNAEDGDIGMYTLQRDGRLSPATSSPSAGKPVMPMSVSPDRRFLYAAVRSKPFAAVTYAIDRTTGALKHVGTGRWPRASRTSGSTGPASFLLGASYGGNLVSVNAVGPDGRVGEPLQVIPVGRNAHSIVTDNTNRFVFVPTWAPTRSSSSCSTRRPAG